MRFDVLTLFPEMFSGYLSQSLLNKAIQRGLLSVNLHDIRNWADGRHKQVDDRPFGGGPGMILKVEPVVAAVEDVQQQATAPAHVVMLTPQGRVLTQTVVEELAAKPRLMLICGRYEGFDDRIRQIVQPDEISIGDFILGGGEVASMVVIDAVVRLLPGVLGDEDSAKQDSFSGAQPMLEYGQFTRPREFRGLEVPEVLLSGDHRAIARWREQQSLLKTQSRRADLLQQPARSRKDSSASDD